MIYGSRLKAVRKPMQSKSRLKHGDLPDSLFDLVQLERGIKFEMQKTDDRKLAKEIAKSNLVRFPKYYKYLVKLEKQMKTNFVKRNIKQRMTPNLPWSLKIY